jgi:hypothetical protein
MCYNTLLTGTATLLYEGIAMLSEFGFLRVSANSPALKVGDVRFNTEQIIQTMRSAARDGVTVALLNCDVGHNPLSEVGGKTKLVTEQHPLVRTARSIGIELGG